MPYQHQIDPEKERAVLTLSGEVTGQTLVHALWALVADAAWRPGYHRLWDGRAITTLAFTPDELQSYERIVDELREELGRGRVAIVAARALPGWAERLYRATDPWETRVFDTLEGAQEWLERG